MAGYIVAIDKDGDGYGHVWSSAGDAGNKLVADADLSTYDGDGVGLASEQRLVYVTEYSAAEYAVTLDTGFGKSWYYGLTGGSTFQIPLAASTTYTLVVWINVVSTTAGFFLRVRRNGGVVLATGGQLPGNSTWTKTTLQFTTDASTTHVGVGVEKANSVIAGFEIAGIMIVQGTTVPTHYNAGGSFMNDQIHDDVVRARWFRGMREAYDPIFSPGTGWLEIKNTSGNYWPGTSSWLTIGAVVMIAYDDDTTVHQLTRMRVVDVRAEGSDYVNQNVRVLLQDASVRFYNGYVHHSVVLDFPFLGWLASLVEGSIASGGNFGVAPLLVESLGYKKTPGSPMTIDYIGDRYDDGETEYVAMRRLAFITRCRVWLTRWDAVQVWAYNATENTADATISAFEDVDYRLGVGFANVVLLSAAARTATAGNTLLWENQWSGAVHGGRGSVLPVKNGATEIMFARLRDSMGRTMGITLMQAATPTTNWLVNSARTGGGTNLTASCSVTYEALGSTVKITVTNSSGTDGYLKAQIYGTGLILDELTTRHAVDAASVAQHGVHVLDHREFEFAELQAAVDTAAWLVSKRKDPREMARFITLSEKTGFTHILNRELFDLVTIQESGHSGLNDLHCIISEEHEIDLGSYRHVCVFGLEIWEHTS